MKTLVKNMETKRQIREKYKKIRENLSKEEVMDYSEKICEMIGKSTFYQKAEQIGCYYPLGKEVSLIPLVQKAWADGKVTLFPKVVGEDMFFYPITDFSQLEEGYFHVMEPDEALCQMADWKFAQDEKTVILTPGVAFDKTGGRMGYGKGFYDRFFAKYPNCVRIGVCYEAQIADHLILESHDRRLQYITTEQGKRESTLYKEERKCN